MKHLFITGASSGIGYAIVKEALSQAYFLHATVRNEADAKRLSELSEHISTYVMDITNSESIEKTASALKEKLNGEKLHALINNAGIAVAGPIELIDPADVRFQFEVNVFGTLAVSQALLPLLNHENSYLINISSKSALISLPFTGAYSASKMAIEGMTDAMRREMCETGINFVLIEPGAVKTPIWDKAEKLDLSAYKGSRYDKVMERVKKEVVKGGQNSAPVEGLAELILSILRTKKPKTRYLYSKNVLKEILIPKWLSDKRLDKIVRKQLFGT